MGFFDKIFGGSSKIKDGPGCVSCDSTNVLELGPGAYQCKACGYEGGPGYAAWQAQQQVKTMQDLPAVQLQKKAKKQLGIVRGMITSYEPSSESIGKGKRGAAGELARAGEGVMEATEALADTVGAVGDMGIIAGELGGALSNTRNKRFALMEIRQAASNLRQILYAWSQKPGHGPTVPQALAVSESLMVDAIRNVQQKSGLVQILDHLEGLIDQGAFGP